MRIGRRATWKKRIIGLDKNDHHYEAREDVVLVEITHVWPDYKSCVVQEVTPEGRLSGVNKGATPDQFISFL